MAMLGEPELLILDEPINGLDPSGIVEFRQLLKRLNEEKEDHDSAFQSYSDRTAAAGNGIWLFK